MNYNTVIKPIETRYKGYRFRSRLEARWAVAFDYDGLNWEYEHEGYNVDGKYYLPDFVIKPSDKNTFSGLIEVKPDTYDNPPTVYMAGRMGNGNWRRWRPAEVSDSCIFNGAKVAPIRVLLDNGMDFIYSGPFGDGMDNHSFLHGLDGGIDYQEHIVVRSFHGIMNADCVLAVIDDLECFGTLVEIGYAKALNKKLFIACVGDRFLSTARLDDADLNIEELEYYVGTELWFALKCADKRRYFNEYDKATEWLLNSAGAIVRHEFAVLRKLSKSLSVECCVLYGAPKNHRRIFSSGGNLILSESAYSAGQSARFEHGECP